jgi:aspartate racemase
MSWESTVPYYRVINETVAGRLGGLHSARLLLWSFDFAELETLLAAGRWNDLSARLGEAGRRLADAGADFLVLCTNTMHRVADAVELAADIPLLHIADATADVVLQAGVERVGLLGTRFTMEEPFYRERLEGHGLDVRVPGLEERAEVDRVIFEELCRGEIRDDSRAAFRRILARLADEGAEGVVLGCTEIGLLVGAEDASVPLFDTAEIHARAAAERALS